jgi:hypothetical protein
MALAMAVKHHIWLKSSLFELLKDPSTPSAVFADNMSAIDIAHNRKVNDRSKHIDISYHFSREQIEEGKLTLLHVPSIDNIADICTKGLTRPIHQHLCTLLTGNSTK